MKVNMPKLNSTMEEASVVEIPVKVGDKVSEGDILFEVETDKVVSAVEAPQEGTVKEVFIEEGDLVKVDSPVLELE